MRLVNLSSAVKEDYREIERVLPVVCVDTQQADPESIRKCCFLNARHGK
jgi:hypothetical protein